MTFLFIGNPATTQINVLYEIKCAYSFSVYYKIDFFPVNFDLLLQLNDKHIHVGPKWVAPRERLILSHKSTRHLLRNIYSIFIMFNCAKKNAAK